MRQRFDLTDKQNLCAAHVGHFEFATLLSPQACRLHVVMYCVVIWTPESMQKSLSAVLAVVSSKGRCGAWCVTCRKCSPGLELFYTTTVAYIIQ
jgi:hypothetical protein